MPLGVRGALVKYGLQQVATDRGKNLSRAAGEGQADQDRARDRNQEDDRSGAILGLALRVGFCLHCTSILRPMPAAGKSTQVMK